MQKKPNKNPQKKPPQQQQITQTSKKNQNPDTIPVPKENSSQTTENLTNQKPPNPDVFSSFALLQQQEARLHAVPPQGLGVVVSLCPPEPGSAIPAIWAASQEHMEEQKCM